MKQAFVKHFNNVPGILLQTTVVGFLVFYLTGCTCRALCESWGNRNFLINKNTGAKVYCREACENSYGSSNTLSHASNADTTQNSNSNSPLSGEIFSNTISFGSALSFKSSNEEYGGGYGKHEPGVGFNVGVGTVLPFNEHWAIAPSVRFTQKSASEKISYSGGPGSSMEFKDIYKYNYIGATLMAQYRAGKHLSFVAGPEINFLAGASVKNGGSSGTGEKQSITKTSNKVGLDMLAGIKFEIPAGNNRSRWGLQLLYDHRISRLNKKKDENGFAVPAYKMKGIQLGLAYNICGCGKKK